MSLPGISQTKYQIENNIRIKNDQIKKQELKKENLTICKKVSSEIIFIILDEYKHVPIEIRQSHYGSIYIDIYDKTIRISDHEIDTINYNYQIIINSTIQDKINKNELTKIIYNHD